MVRQCLTDRPVRFPGRRGPHYLASPGNESKVEEEQFPVDGDGRPDPGRLHPLFDRGQELGVARRRHVGCYRLGRRNASYPRISLTTAMKSSSRKLSR